MRKSHFALVLSLLVGCAPVSEPGPAPGVVVKPEPPALYDFYESGRATWHIEGEPVRLVQIKNRKTGKVFLLAYHDGSQAESMVKLDEWQEEPEVK